jgi:hypothetical protein
LSCSAALLRPPAVAGLLLILTVRAEALASPPPALARSWTFCPGTRSSAASRSGR